MMIALFSDIHANIVAFRAALDDATSLGVTEWYCLGDIVGYGSDPGECVNLVPIANLLHACGDAAKERGSQHMLDQRPAIRSYPYVRCLTFRPPFTGEDFLAGISGKSVRRIVAGHRNSFQSTDRVQSGCLVCCRFCSFPFHHSIEIFD